MHINSQIRAIAEELSIDAIGFTPLDYVEGKEINQFEQWLSSGRHGAMGYLEKYQEQRRNPKLLLPEAKSVIVIAVSYYPNTLPQEDSPQIAKYALGRDYHKVIKQLLKKLAHEISQRVAPHIYRCIVDTAPFFERYWAYKSSIGFIGKNSNLIVPKVGSFVFLGELLTSLELQSDLTCKYSCGTCVKCQTNCPTKALTNSGFDARRCINYLTIEYKGEIPSQLSQHFGNRLYGCDTCQDVCPYNKSPKPTSHFPSFNQLLNLSTQDITDLNQDKYAKLFYGTPMTRAKLEGMQRNALIYLNNNCIEDDK